MLFEMLTGHLPFESDEPRLVWNLHLHAPPPWLAEREPAAACEDLDAVIHALLAKSPDDRFASALAVMRALDSIADGGG
jgi:serine/threonine-protein kinase